MANMATCVEPGENCRAGGRRRFLLSTLPIIWRFGNRSGSTKIGREHAKAFRCRPTDQTGKHEVEISSRDDIDGGNVREGKLEGVGPRSCPFRSRNSDFRLQLISRWYCTAGASPAGSLQSWNVEGPYASQTFGESFRPLPFRHLQYRWYLCFPWRCSFAALI